MLKEVAKKQTLYEQIANIVIERIASGHYQVGQMLPSEMDFSKMLGVSQGTVRKGLDDLVRQGVLERRQGVGTFVTSMNADWGDHILVDLDSNRDANVVPQQQLLKMELGNCDEMIAGKLGLAKEARIWEVLTVWRAKGRKVALDRVCLPYDGLEFLGDFPGNDHLVGFHNIIQTRLKTRLMPVELSIRLARSTELSKEHLDLEPGSSIIKLTRISAGTGGDRLEYRARALFDSGYELRLMNSDSPQEA